MTNLSGLLITIEIICEHTSDEQNGIEFRKPLKNLDQKSTETKFYKVLGTEISET